MSLNIDQALQSAGSKTPDWLVEQRDAACNNWAATVLPSRKTEQWKYTSIKPLQQTFTTAPVASPSQAELENLVPDLGGLRLVFANGHWLSELSSSPEALAIEGLTLVRFSEATAEQSDRIAAALGRATPDQGHPFLPLNLAALDNGVFIEVADGVSIHAPIQVVSLTMGGDAPFAVNTRLLVSAGVNSAVTIVEHFADAGACASFTNSVTELLLAPGATVNHCRLNLEEGHALHVGGVHTKLERDATLNGFYLGLGADLKRVDLVANMEGAGAHAEMNGIYLPRGKEHVDYHTCLEHVSPHCTSTETFRGVIADQARAVFNGRIHIHPQAQKTSAELSNKNLLTSAQAEISTKPELEIYADDVQCAHGATVAQLNPQSLHYLRSRGISKAEAEVMLGFGFVNEVLEGLRLEVLREALRPLLARRFARDESLMRHLA